MSDKEQDPPARKFNPGDVVRLKSGTQLMTVEGYERDGKVNCWFERQTQYAPQGGGGGNQAPATMYVLPEAILVAVADEELKNRAAHYWNTSSNAVYVPTRIEVRQ